jgi:endonuclease/exonuclease/phosphatase family metal-dependent hydrolase
VHALRIAFRKSQSNRPGALPRGYHWIGESFMTVRIPAFFSVLILIVCASDAETISLATYNIEHFETRFEAYRLSKTPEAKESELVKELVDAERRQNEEDQWEISQVIADPAFNPDILVIQEGCSESNLRYFNKRWLNGAYETAIVFPTNTDRNQNLGMMLKPGFKIVARKDKYHLEKDEIDNGRGGFLFARGPAFCLIETPSGYRFWVGVTHQKSKSGNSVEVSAWRNREAKRTHEIMLELQKSGPEDVMLLGDMNDDLGVGEFEDDPKSGGDSIATLVGPAKDKFVLVTEKLAKAGEISFGGYWNTKYRSFIDHVLVTPGMKDQIENVSVFRGSLAAAASDHFPVIVKVKSDAPSAKNRTKPPGNNPKAKQ